MTRYDYVIRPLQSPNISLPDTLNASVIAKLRYKINEDGRDKIEWSDEAAIVVGGRVSEDIGFLMELGLVGIAVEGKADPGNNNVSGNANAFFSTKVHFNVANLSGTQLSIIPYSTDGPGAGYGMELLNTGHNVHNT